MNSDVVEILITIVVIILDTLLVPILVSAVAHNYITFEVTNLFIEVINLVNIVVVLW